MSLRIAVGCLFCAICPLLGCAEIALPAVTVPAAGSGQITMRPPTVDPEGATPGEQAAMQSLIDETFRVLRSNEFQSGVMEVAVFPDGLWLSPHGDTIPADKALAAYLGLDPRFTNVVSRVKWTTVNVTDSAPGKPAEALIQLGRSVLTQWSAAQVLRKSCAINSMAHELAHTVPQKQGEYIDLFTDDGRWWATCRDRALVSYTFGSVAQCVYLQEKGDPLGRDLKECVKHWGTNQFYSHDCY